MAETLQVITASFHLVGVTIEICRLVKRIAHVKDEAKRWLEKTQTMRSLAKQINTEVKARDVDRKTVGREASKDELAIENCLAVSLRRFANDLRQMRDKILRGKSHEDFMNTLPDRLRMMYDTQFIQNQQADSEFEIQSMTLALHLLDSQDRRRDRALLMEIATLIKDTLMPSLASDDVEIYLPAREWPDMEVCDEPPSTTTDNMFEDDLSSGTDDESHTSQLSRENLLLSTGGPFMTALKRHNLPRVKGFLQTYPEVEVQVYDEEMSTVLHHAVRQGDAELLATLLQHDRLREPVYLDHHNRQNYTALMEAARLADRDHGPDLVKLLLEHGCDVDAKADKNWTAVYFAAYQTPNKNSFQVMDMLLEKHVNLNVVKDTVSEQRLRQWPNLRKRIAELPQEAEKKRPRAGSIKRFTKAVIG